MESDTRGDRYNHGPYQSAPGWRGAYRGENIDPRETSQDCPGVKRQRADHKRPRLAHCWSLSLVQLLWSGWSGGHPTAREIHGFDQAMPATILKGISAYHLGRNSGSQKAQYLQRCSAEYLPFESRSPSFALSKRSHGGTILDTRDGIYFARAGRSPLRRQPGREL
jgi:hypothetical protein